MQRPSGVRGSSTFISENLLLPTSRGIFQLRFGLRSWITTIVSLMPAFLQHSWINSSMGAIVFAVRSEESRQGEFRLDLPVRTQVDGSSCWEGDLTLDYWFQERLLHRMTFSVVSSKFFDGQEDTVLFIGGSQSYGDRELRREASLFNYQINSATAALIAVKGVAEALDLPRIYAVKALNQMTLHLRPGDPGSAYEDFWLANYGNDRGSFFELPLQAGPERDSPVAGSHGSRTRRKRLDRQRLKDFVETEFRALIGNPRPEPLVTHQSQEDG